MTQAAAEAGSLGKVMVDSDVKLVAEPSTTVVFVEIVETTRAGGCRVKTNGLRSHRIDQRRRNDIVRELGPLVVRATIHDRRSYFKRVVDVNRRPVRVAALRKIARSLRHGRNRVAVYRGG